MSLPIVLSQTVSGRVTNRTVATKANSRQSTAAIMSRLSVAVSTTNTAETRMMAMFSLNRRTSSMLCTRALASVIPMAVTESRPASWWTRFAAS